MAPRIIMRIELTPVAKEALQNFADHAGMTQFAITSKLVTWFSEQPESVQRIAMTRDSEVDAGPLILRNMVAKGGGAVVPGPKASRAGAAGAAGGAEE